MSDQQGPIADNDQFAEYGNASTRMPYAPYPPQPSFFVGLQPVLPSPASPKKPLYFPLTRNASIGKQVKNMATYSLLMLVLFAGSIIGIAQTSVNQKPDNIFIHLDGTANGSLILLFSAFILLTIPAMSLLCGALFGAMRALIVTCAVEVVSAGICLLYAFMQHLTITLSINTPIVDVFILLPIAAALVGFCYDRRHVANWGKSFLNMLLGSAFMVIVLLALIATLGNPGSSASQSTITSFYIGIGCFGLLTIPLLALPMAGIEGFIHAIIVARRASKQNGQHGALTWPH